MKLVLGSPKGGAAKPKSATSVEQVGTCVVCKAGVFSDEDFGRAPKPLLGKAHTRCGGAR